MGGRVPNRERRRGERGRRERARHGFRRQPLELVLELGERHTIGVEHRGDHVRVLGRDHHADVDPGVELEPTVAIRGVGPRMLA